MSFSSVSYFIAINVTLEAARDYWSCSVFSSTSSLACVTNFPKRVQSNGTSGTIHFFFHCQGSANMFIRTSYLL